MKKNRKIIRSCFALTIFSMLLPFSVQAVQTESPIDCIEGNTPLLNYGDYTSCTIENVTDRDQFALSGATGDVPRFIVNTATALDPRLEIRDPDGVLLHDFACSGACTIEVEPQDFNIEPSPDNTLAKSGVYLIAVSDSGSNGTGSYILAVENFDPPSIDPVGLTYDIPEDDGVSPVTDIDFFAFQIAAGKHARVVVNTTTALDPRLEIRDPDGILLHDGACSGACTLSVEPQDFNVVPSLDNTFTKSGDYLVTISDSGSNGTGTYQLNVLCLDAFCGLTPAFAVCDIEMSQAAYIDGETITAQQFRVANPGSSDIAVELKAWFETPTGAVIRTLNVPSINLSAGFDIDLGPIPFFTVQPTTPRGTWEYGCRLLDPVTGRQRSFDRTTFELQ